MKFSGYFTKNSLIIGLFIALVLLILVVTKSPKVVFDDSVYIKKENELRREIDSLSNVVKIETQTKNSYINKIDSLTKIKKRVRYVYVQKTKKIDTASVNYLIKEFKSVFSTSGVK